LYMMHEGIAQLPSDLFFSREMKEISKTANISIKFDTLLGSFENMIISSPSQEIRECVKKGASCFLLPSPVNGRIEKKQTKTNSLKTKNKSFTSPRKTAIIPYTASVEQEMRKFYNTLSEKDKRRYAGIEALKKERGGISYVSSILKCSRKTVSKGMKELQNLPIECKYKKRIRNSGGGRKPYFQVHKDIDNKFVDVLIEYTAGDPMNEDIKWTNLSHLKISELMHDKHGLKISTKVVRQLLKNNNYRRRKMQKKTIMKRVDNRNEQFVNINNKKAEYNSSKNPIISIDTKKKEKLGNFYRDGRLYTQGELHTYDHDFASFAEGVVIPHGIYDCKNNTAYINIGTSKDTGEFACDCLRNWWYNEGKIEYPDATSILILCDGGGSNSSRHYLFKEDLQKLVDEIGIEIRIAHYPPYCSKYNPIEHRLFPHVTRPVRE